MSIKSIPLKTWEVQAILDDRKSTMRRVVKPHNARKAKLCEYAQGDGLWIDGGYIEDYSVPSCWMKIENYISKYAAYKPGDILWVRETWHKDAGRYMYKADYADAKQFFCADKEVKIRWSNSIHMPREAARLFLRVKSVRVERLQACGNAQAKDEGCTDCSQFIRLWDSSLPKNNNKFKCAEGEWRTNPWVWVIEFEQCEKPEGWDTYAKRTI